jgi:hypothetical protein
MSAEAAQGVVMGGYARGLFCECGARRSDKAGVGVPLERRRGRDLALVERAPTACSRVCVAMPLSCARLFL